jgi:hypothetical protein
MLLSRLIVDPSRFQFRESAFSETTVAGICAEGINLAKFDPLPILPAAGDRYCVAGDGHSRFEAVRRLAELNQLPAAWIVPGGDWEIPAREVNESEAKKLSWTANLSRDNFTPTEEARVYKSMRDDGGMSIAEIAKWAHRDDTTVRRTLLINDLAGCIRACIGKPADAGGIAKDLAVTMAELFNRYGIAPQQQAELWHRVFAHSELTPGFIRGVLTRIGGSLAARTGGDGVLFSIPANVEHVVKEMKDRAQELRRIERALTAMMGCKDSEAMASLPALKALLDAQGESMLAQIKYEADADGCVIGQMVLVA